MDYLLNFEQSPPTQTPHPSPCSMTARQNVAGGGLSGRGDLATSSVELVWLVITAPGSTNVLQLHRQAWWTEGQSTAPASCPAPWQQMPHGGPRAFSRRGDVGERQSGHRSPCPCHAQRRPSQQAGRQPAVLSCPPSFSEAECNSSFARALCRLKQKAVRDN